MRETKFIQQNKKKWFDFELSLKNPKQQDADKLSDIFVQVTDDLSYSRTFYPNRSVRVYLNKLAQGIFSNIYKSRKDFFSKFSYFWKEELPALVYLSRKELLLSLIIFLFAFGIGIFSSIHDPEFCRIILGDQYVEMTKANIESGDPMAVYKQVAPVDMFLAISLNNLLVAFRTFILGAFFAIGTIVILLYNGIMVGAFQYFFIEKGLFWESFLTIWIHGTLEISSIILAGGAGLVMGKGLIFPNTFSRLKSFQNSARRGLKIMLGITPIFIFAALMEGFITRFTEVHPIFKALIIIVSLFFIIFYFVWYPYIKFKEDDPMKKIAKTRLATNEKLVISTQGIKSNGEIFKETFLVFRRFFKKIFWLSLTIAILFAVLFTFVLKATGGDIHYTSLMGQVFRQVKESISFQNNITLLIATVFNFNNLLIYFLNTTAFALIITFSNVWAIKILDRNAIKYKLKNYLNCFLKSFFVVGLIFSVIMLPGTFLKVVLLIVTLPIFLLLLFIAIYENKNPLTLFVRTFVLLGSSFIKLYGLFLMFYFIGFIFINLIESPFILFYHEIINMNLMLDAGQINMIHNFLSIVTLVTSLGLIASILTIGSSLLYFSLREINEAKTLKEEIEKFGTPQKTIYGKNFY